MNNSKIKEKFENFKKEYEKLFLDNDAFKKKLKARISAVKKEFRILFKEAQSLESKQSKLDRKSDSFFKDGYCLLSKADEKEFDPIADNLTDSDFVPTGLIEDLLHFDS